MDILQSKVRQVILSCGKKPGDFAGVIGASSQMASNRFSKGIKSIKDLAKICQATGARLTVTTKTGDIIDFTSIEPTKKE